MKTATKPKAKAGGRKPDSVDGPFPYDGWVSKARTAKFLDVTDQSVDALVEAGKLTPRKLLGRTIRFSAKQVREVME